MFKIFKRTAELETIINNQQRDIRVLCNRVGALEDHLNVEYFNGPKYKPHYRKRKVVAKKLGRPRKKK